MWTKTPGGLWGPPLLLHLTAWDPNIQGNKNTGLWSAGRLTTLQLSPQRCEGFHTASGPFPVVCGSLPTLRWDQKLREALIRGWAVSQVSYNLDLPPDWRCSAHGHLDPLSGVIQAIRRCCRFYINNAAEQWWVWVRRRYTRLWISIWRESVIMTIKVC